MADRSHALISFVTQPGRGSEGGVGWAIAAAANRYAHRRPAFVHLVVDARDSINVEAALGADRSPRVMLHPVALPGWAERRWGQSRTRASYMAWLPSARRVLRRLDQLQELSTIHQVTFASAVLPPAFSSTSRAHRIWGPVNLPWAPTLAQGATASSVELARLRAAKVLARRNARRADTIIATNEMTADFFSYRDEPALIEPNIFLEQVTADGDRQDDLISLVGSLDNLKRPWLALECLATPELSAFRLQVVGDGPLRADLVSLAARLGISDRVVFVGQLPHQDTLAAIARSRVLLHPSSREGASWVIGEAAALGVPSVVFDSVGASTTVRLSRNGGQVVSASGDLVAALAGGVLQAAHGTRPGRSNRWDASRLDGLLDEWWDVA